jgi:hypothetical protein
MNNWDVGNLIRDSVVTSTWSSICCLNEDLSVWWSVWDSIRAPLTRSILDSVWMAIRESIWGQHNG